jgi:hypothetical protein
MASACGARTGKVTENAVVSSRLSAGGCSSLIPAHPLFALGQLQAKELGQLGDFGVGGSEYLTKIDPTVVVDEFVAHSRHC